MRALGASWIVAAALALPASAAGALVADPKFLTGSVADRVAAEMRGFDQVANPHYMRLAAPFAADYLLSGDPDVLVDPFRLGWNRGTQLQTSLTNRYGARLNVRLWGPPASAAGPHPAILLAPGSGNEERGYRGMAQGLAEAGYVVMAYEPQYQGESDADPPAAFCQAGGDWQEPQELGVRERGPCAGAYPDEPLPGEGALTEALAGTPAASLGFTADAVLFAAQLYLSGTYPDVPYDGIRPRHLFAGFDATAWLLSEANPWRGRIDGQRLGIIGHSAGADAALHVANGDPLERFSTAVMWDSGSPMLAHVTPKVPTMVQYGEDQNIFGPRLQNPDIGSLPSPKIAERFRAAGVPTSLVPLRGSTHQEWLYLPFQMINPYLAPFFNASRYGERVGLYFTLAWLDRWLMPSRAADAHRRLTAATFDGSADASSIGAGRADLLGRNAPYRIAGRRIDDHLSRTLPSFRLGG